MSMLDLNDLDLGELFARFVQGPNLDALLEIAIKEDLGEQGDITTTVVVDPKQGVGARIRAREAGVLAGTPILDLIMRRHAPRLSWWWLREDGERIESGDVICEISGPLAELLPVERVMLNMLGRLSGIATTTSHFVDAVAGTSAHVCDTRKTTPGLRVLEKYATRCGGAHLHRVGLFDAVLVKDNHIGPLESSELADRLLQAARRARATRELRFVQVEVDDLEQLDAVLGIAAGVIDMVLLDNMPPKVLREAVAMRDEQAPGVILEASGGVTLATIGAIASSGVDRISVGALTHSSVQLDFGLDLE